MFYESLIILNISTLNFSEGVPASVRSIYILRIMRLSKSFYSSIQIFFVMSALYVLSADQENRLFFFLQGFRTSLSNHKQFISDTRFDSEKGPSENLITYKHSSGN